MKRTVLHSMSALALSVLLILTAIPSEAAYSSGTANGTTAGLAWTGSWTISTTTVTGHISSPSAHNVGVYLKVKYYDSQGNPHTENYSTIHDPGTSATCSFIAGTGRTVRDNSTVKLEVEAYIVLSQ